jgi:hypothetical protein
VNRALSVLVTLVVSLTMAALQPSMPVGRS